MAVSTLNTDVSYTGNGSQTSFPITFQFLDSSQVKVSLNGTPSLAFTVVSSNVIMTTAPGSGVVVRVYRETSLVQPTDYLNNAAFPAETHEAALDRLLMQVQELAARIYALENP